MKQQSSIEWLYNKMYEHRGNITIEEFQQAKSMHEKEHRDTWDNSIIENKDDNYIGKQKTFEQYYNETFEGGNK